MNRKISLSSFRPIDESHRQSWLVSRLTREAKLGGRPNSRWTVLRFRALSRIMELMVRGTGLYGRGHRNALDIKLSSIEFKLPGLPAAFDGYRILHLSDLHFDTIAGIPEAVHNLVKDSSFDLCVLTGDFSDHHATPAAQTVAHIRSLCDGITAQDGIFSVLGNHDSAALVGPVEAGGIRFLLNETIKIMRGAQNLTMTGVDDVNAFWSDSANRVLEESGEGFKIALVHSPELATVAMTNGYALYLTGHTHGGQVCLPGGRAMATGLRKHTRLYRGRWRHGNMDGYTTTGVGVSNIPIRFNCPGEVAVITLRVARAGLEMT